MSEKIVDNALPDVWATEDTIFNMCMNEIEEFPQYITNLMIYLGIFLKDIFLPHSEI